MITLRATTLADLDFVLAAETAPENRYFIGQWTHAEHAAALADSNIRHLIIEANGAETPVGYAILIGLTSPHQSTQLRRFVITAKGQGYGRHALQHIKQAAFSAWQVHRLWLEVIDTNERARNLYLSEGFVLEGLQRDLLKLDGNFVSVHIMSLLQPEYVAPVSPLS